MVDADVVDGEHAEQRIGRFFENSRVASIHAHDAKRGRHAARIARVTGA
jgi:hypothetical protein